ncbi:hypothetical protein [Prosthecobacter sp.]|uniref:hypothetical protein n=1 Tax=Prosthecobacter sp. TaxID=1965333 RepID=UPI00378351EC
MRMALGEYLDTLDPHLRETGTGYTAPPPPEAPPVKHRRAIRPARIDWSFYVVTRAAPSQPINPLLTQ